MCFIYSPCSWKGIFTCIGLPNSYIHKEAYVNSKIFILSAHQGWMSYSNWLYIGVDPGSCYISLFHFHVWQDSFSVHIFPETSSQKKGFFKPPKCLIKIHRPNWATPATNQASTTSGLEFPNSRNPLNRGSRNDVEFRVIKCYELLVIMTVYRLCIYVKIHIIYIYICVICIYIYIYLL